MSLSTTVYFYIVGTPIGNLQDISLRAIETLKNIEFLVCEDTRTSQVLLKRFDIRVPKLLSYNAQSSTKKEEEIIGLLEEGKTGALITDAGTPLISDPGAKLINNIRKSLGDSVKITPIPGPSALTSALSVSGLPSSEFLFLGFPPNKKRRESFFKQVALSEVTVVFYESPHRIKDALKRLENILDSDRPVFVGREMTKHFEEFLYGGVGEIMSKLEESPEKVRGEFTVVLAGKKFKMKL